MRKIMIWMILILAMAGIASAAVNTLSDSTPHIFVTLLNQEPDPAEPGENTDLRFKIENYGTTAESEVAVEIVPEYPFTLIPGEKQLRELGTIGAREFGRTGVIEKFRLKIDKDAAEGTAEIKLRVKTKRAGWFTWDAFNVSVRTQDAIIAVQNVAGNEIPPGAMSNVTIQIQNLADSLLKDIKVNLGLERELRTSTAVSYEKFPFAPVGSTNEKALKQLAAGQSSEITFTVRANSDAEPNSYKIPLTIRYNDNTGRNYTKESIIGLTVGGKPELALLLQDTQLMPKTAGTVTVKIVNKGAVDSKLAYITIGRTGNYEIIGAESAYIGNIDSDDYETAEFKIYLKSQAGTIQLPIRLEYKDANNKAYTQQETLQLKVYTKEELKKYFGTGNGKAGIVITMLVIAGGLVFYWRWRKRKKKKHHVL